MRNKRVKLVQKGIKVDGTVVRIEKITSVDNDGKSYTYKPVVKYLIADNEWITKASQIQTYPCPYKIGDKVKVIYDPDKTDYFTLNDGPALTVEIAMFSIGIIAFVYVIIMLFVGR